MTSTMAIELAQRRVNEFRQRGGDYGETALHLAYHAALPVALNAELLHLFRINFFLDPPEILPYTAEFEFLLSPLCREIDEGLYEIEPEIRDVLLAGLTQTYDAQRIRDLATLLWQYVEHHSPWRDRVELERAQQLTALNFLDSEKAQQWLASVEPNANQGEVAEREWFVAMRQEIENQTQLHQDVVQRTQEELSDEKLNQFEVTLRSLSDSQGWTLQGEVFRIGRGENNDLVLQKLEVSRQHAEISRRYLSYDDAQPAYVIRDLSRYGTWLLTPDTEEWQRINQQEVVLPFGTQLKFGDLRSPALEFVVTPIEIPEQVESYEHPDTVLSVNDQADVYATVENSIEIEQLYHQALSIAEQQSGANHPDTQVVCHIFLDLMHDAIEKSKTDVSNDPFARLVLSIKQIDKDIERQTQHSNSIYQQQSQGPSVDAETLKLKHLIGKRKQLFEMCRQIIDSYNQTAKGIIDTLDR